jgi:uncharacterized membrane protein YtjA (UPF0391 family)
MPARATASQAKLLHRTAARNFRTHDRVIGVPESSCAGTSWGIVIMLRWALIFLVISLIAALFGFTGIAVAAAGIAKFLFFLFLVITVVLFALVLSAARSIR